MSAEQDRRFIDTFMLVIGMLVAVAVGLYLLAQVVAERTATQFLKEDPAYRENIAERIDPIAQVAVAGMEQPELRAPGGLASVEPDPGASPAGGAGAVAELQDPKAIHDGVCAACHGQGIAGAPKTGDAAAWDARIGKGMDTLVQHAVQGFQGEAGYMPPKGGNANLSDEQVRAAVQYMVEQSGG